LHDFIDTVMTSGFQEQVGEKGDSEV
jgi:hypothetical protein